MELDEFKQTYQLFGSSFHRKSEEELQKILHNQVDSVVERIKRSLKLEIVFVLFFSLFVVYVLITFHGTYFKLLASLILGFSLLFTRYLIILSNKVKAYHAASHSVKENLKQFILIINRFTRLYFQFTIAFVPVACILLPVIIIADEGNAPISVTLSNTLIYCTASLVWCMLMYFFTRWYVQSLYGKHLQHLRNHLTELENKL